MILPEVPFVDLQNALSTIIAFHKILFLVKELISQQKRYGDNSWS